MTALAESTTRGSLTKIHDDVEFYPHQVEGIRKMVRMGSLILADEMGLGKSLQALTICAVDYDMGRASRVLIVAPASLKWNWQAEIELFTDFSCVVLDGTRKQRDKQLEDFDADILVVNYEQVGPHLEQLNEMAFDIDIADEAHYIKGPTSARTKAYHGIHSKRHLLLTGSPLLNHANDLWSLLHRVSPADFPRYYAFRNRYCLFGGFKDKEIVGTKNEKELHEKVGRYMLRRLKKDVLDLPEKQHIQVIVDLSPEQRKLYQQAIEEMKIDLPGEASGMELENALTKMLRLKQICGTTATIPGYGDHSIKLDRAVEMVQEIIESGEPVVVFTQFRDVQAAFNRRLTAVGVDWRELNGDTPQRERVPIVKEWSEDAAGGKPQAMVAMLQVAGVGLNMTAASKAWFLDKLWVPKLNEQGEDRLHRIGASKTQPIQIFEMITRGTIEQRVEVILRRKRKVFDTLVEESDWKRRLAASLLEDDDD